MASVSLYPHIRTPLSSSEILASALETELQTEATVSPCLLSIVRIFFASSIFGNAITMLLLITLPLLFLLQSEFPSTAYCFLQPPQGTCLILIKRIKSSASLLDSVKFFQFYTQVPTQPSGILAPLD